MRQTNDLMWQADDHEAALSASDAVVDLAFRIDCAQLPVDHAWLLYRALARVLPWLQAEPCAAVHSIFGAASGNGWTRPPADAGALIQLSKRTRLSLRLPQHRVSAAARLSGCVLDIGGHSLAVGSSQVKPLRASSTVFARSVAVSVAGAHIEAGDEAAFSRAVAERLAAMNIRAPKLLCGLAHSIATDGATFGARSVMLAELGADESIRIQQRGLGADLKLGCGIFLPHKNIAAVPKHN